MIEERKLNIFFAIILGLLIDFSVLAHAAHDLWASIIVYGVVLILFVAVLWLYGGSEKGPGLSFPLAGLAGFVLLSFYISFQRAANPSEAFLSFMGWTAAILIFLIAHQIFVTRQTFSIFIYCLIPCILFEFGVHCHQNILFINRIPTIEFFGMPTITEPYGTLLNANISAAFHLFWVPIFLGFAIRNQSHKGSVLNFSLIIVALLIAIIFMTYSVWAWVCLLMDCL